MAYHITATGNELRWGYKYTGDDRVMAVATPIAGDQYYLTRDARPVQVLATFVIGTHGNIKQLAQGIQERSQLSESVILNLQAQTSDTTVVVVDYEFIHVFCNHNHMTISIRDHFELDEYAVNEDNMDWMNNAFLLPKEPQHDH